MSPKTREEIRLLILSSIAAARGYAVPLEGIRLSLPPEHRRMDDADLRAEVLYLVDKGLIAPEEKTISPENYAWKITAAGRDFLAMEGLA
jgi:RIO-like serine/threonine protein kinase